MREVGQGKSLHKKGQSFSKTPQVNRLIRPFFFSKYNHFIVSTFQDTDESGGLGESPYIGKARYKANRFAREGQMSAPNQVMMQNASDMSSPGGAGPRRAEVSGQLQKQLDAELAEKQDKVNKSKYFVLKFKC